MSHTPALPQFSTLAPFDHQPRTRIVFGQNSLEKLGELSRELGARKILLVTDPGIVAAGHVEHALKILDKADVEVSVFDRAAENPTTACVDDWLDIAKRERI